MKHNLIPQKGTTFFTSTKFPDSFWGSTSLLFNLAPNSPPGGEAVGAWNVTSYLHVVSNLRVIGSICTSTPPTCLDVLQRRKFVLPYFTIQVRCISV